MKDTNTAKASHIELINIDQEPQSKVINRLGDDEWTITHPITFEEEVIKFGKSFPDTDRKLHVLIQQWIEAKGKRDSSGRIFLKNFEGFLSTFRWLTKALQSLEHTKLDRINASEILEILTWGIHKRGTDTVISSSYFEKRFLLLRDFHLLYIAGNLNDGFTSFPSQTEALDAIKDLVVSSGSDWASWLHGSSYGSVPIPLAMIYLSEAMNIIRSDDVRWSIFMHQFIEKHDEFFSKTPGSWNFSAAKEALQGIEQPSNPELYEDFKKEAKKFSKNGKGLLKLGSFPFESNDDWFKIQQLVFASAIIIFLCVTGARRSELMSIINGDVWFDKKNRRYNFKSEIKKTNHSIKTVRYIAGIAAEAVEVIESNCIGKAIEELPLFTQNTITFKNSSNWPLGYIQIDHCGKNSLNMRLSLFAEMIADKYGEEFRDMAKSVTPHQFRHTFAEFAIRRFDGNIKEAIRDHFRHQYGSFMTDEYMMGKIKEGAEEYRDQSDILPLIIPNEDDLDSPVVMHDYLVELVKRVRDGTETLFGPIGKFLHDVIKSNVSFMDDEELEEFVRDEFEGTVHPHEYGLCVIRKETKMQAQCYDKKTGMARTEEAKFSLCGGCQNRLSLEANMDAIFRIGLKAQEHQDAFKDKGLGVLADIESETLILAEKAYEKAETQLENQGEI